MLADVLAKLENDWERQLAASLFLFSLAKARPHAPTVKGERSESETLTNFISEPARTRIVGVLAELKRLPSGWAIESCRLEMGRSTGRRHTS